MSAQRHHVLGRCRITAFTALGYLLWAGAATASRIRLAAQERSRQTAGVRATVKAGLEHSARLPFEQ